MSGEWWVAGEGLNHGVTHSPIMLYRRGVYNFPLGLAAPTVLAHGELPTEMSRVEVFSCCCGTTPMDNDGQSGGKQSYDDHHQNLNSPPFGISPCLIRKTAKKKKKAGQQLRRPGVRACVHASRLRARIWMLAVLLIGWKHGIKRQRHQVLLLSSSLSPVRGNAARGLCGLGRERLVWRVAWLACCV